MVSGEYVSMAIKSAKAKHVKWDVPILLVGNEYPAWTNVGGAMNRRKLGFLFNHSVPLVSGNTKLDQQLEAERPAALRKGLWAYRTQVIVTGTEDYGRKLPDFFKVADEEFSQHSSSIEQFMQAKIVDTDPGETGRDRTYMPREIFLKHYHAYCHRQGLKPMRVNVVNCRSIWSILGIKEAPLAKKMLYNGETYPPGTPWMYGMDLSERVQDSANPCEGCDPNVVDDPFTRPYGGRMRNNFDDDHEGGKRKGRKRPSRTDEPDAREGKRPRAFAESEPASKKGKKRRAEQEDEVPDTEQSRADAKKRKKMSDLNRPPGARSVATAASVAHAAGGDAGDDLTADIYAGDM
jgi:hypothetical protein